MTAPRPALTYILPKYLAADTEHYSHVLPLLEQVAKQLPLALIVERGTTPPKIPNIEPVYFLGSRSKIGRVAQLLRAVLGVRARGCRTFFLRYSRLAATVLLVLRPFLGLRIFYWMSQTTKHQTPRSLRARFQRRHMRWILSKADHPVTGPESMVALLIRAWSVDPGRIRLLYNDVDTRRFVPLDQAERSAVRRARGWSDESVVLFVHRVSPRRGSRLLVPIIDAVRALVPNARLVVVGDGPDMPTLRRAARPYVDLLGALPNRDLPPVYAAADCFLLPSYDEGFPRVLLEAMAAGVVPVAADVGGVADILGSDYPFLARAGDVEGLAGAVATVLADRALRGRLATELRARAVSRYDVETVARSFVECVTQS